MASCKEIIVEHMQRDNDAEEEGVVELPLLLLLLL